VLSIFWIATSWAAAAPRDALLQRLGVSRASLQTLRVDPSRPTISIELGGRMVTLDLERSSLRAPGFRVLVQNPDGSLREAQAPAPDTYRGTVREMPGSIAGGTIRNGELRAAVALADGRTFFIQPLDEIETGATPGLHAVYDASDVVGGDGICATHEPQRIAPPAATPESGGGAAAAAIKSAELAIDADYELYTLNGSSVDATISDVENVINAVNVVYERDCNLTHRLTRLIVRSSEPDPYTSTDPDQLLNEFENSWNASQTGVPRDLAHLMTGKNIDGGVIGIASVGVVCNRSQAYGLSQTRFTSNMSRRCALTAHELGHNWNAVHCDGVSPCNIMCSSIDGCDGIGLPNFEPQGATAIKNFAASRSCLDTPPTAVIASLSSAGVRLAAPAPSPFSKQTGLSFYLEKSLRAELDVYDVAGHRVARLAEGIQSPGWHSLTWNGLDQAGRRLEAGVFYARLHTVDATLTRTLVMVR
jgi:hypothetical protein